MTSIREDLTSLGRLRRSRGTVAALAVVSASLLTSGCGGSQDVKDATQAPKSPVANASNVVYGDQCNNLTNIYSVGRTRGSGGVGPFTSRDELTQGIILFDGDRSSSNSSVKVRLDDASIDQAWTSYQRAIEGIAAGSPLNLKKLNVVTYGDRGSDASSVDGVQDVPNVCISIVDIHGRPAD